MADLDTGVTVADELVRRVRQVLRGVKMFLHKLTLLLVFMQHLPEVDAEERFVQLTNDIVDGQVQPVGDNIHGLIAVWGDMADMIHVMVRLADDDGWHEVVPLAQWPYQILRDWQESVRDHFRVSHHYAVTWLLGYSFDPLLNYFLRVL